MLNLESMNVNYGIQMFPSAVFQHHAITETTMSSKQQPNWQTIESGDIGYDMAQARNAATADLHPKDLERASICLRRFLHCFTTAYRLCRERYRQRRQLLEMDDRQLKDIGITREQAEQEGHKPLWKG
jgi:uncharacterized protein YjiS (DUF1127 family)